MDRARTELSKSGLADELCLMGITLDIHCKCGSIEFKFPCPFQFRMKIVKVSLECYWQDLDDYGLDGQS